MKNFKLSASQAKALMQALTYMSDDRILSSDDLSTYTGCDKRDLLRIIKTLPNLHFDDNDRRIILSVLGDMIGGGNVPSDYQYTEYFTVSREEVESLYKYLSDL